MANATGNTEIKVGTVLVSRWGYGQTNISFYRVESVSAKMVTVQLLGSTEIYNGGAYAYTAMPKLDTPSGNKKTRRRLKLSHEGRPYIAIESFENAYIWDGKPQYGSCGN